MCLRSLGRVILNGKISGAYDRKSGNRHGKYIQLYCDRDLASEAAMAQYDRIASQILTLSEMPARIRVMDSEPEHTLKVRKLSVDDYYVLFQIRGNQVLILRVLHCRQDIEGKLFE